MSEQKPRIVVAVDFSPTSDRALEEAVRLARRLGAELHAVHAYGLAVAALPEGAVMTGPAKAAELAAEAHERLAEREARYPDVTWVRHVVAGVPAEEVVRIAEELGADYIVVGTHGRTGLSHLLFGSVAEQIVRQATVPVVTVRGSKKD